MRVKRVDEFISLWVYTILYEYWPLAHSIHVHSAASERCLSFWYQMFGLDTMQQLSVYVRYAQRHEDTRDRTTLVFRRTRQHGIEWRQALVNIYPNEPFQVSVDSKERRY